MDEAQEITVRDQCLTSMRSRTGQPVQRGSLLERLLGPMNRDVANSFTEAQLQELERVLGASPPRCLPVDIRLTLSALHRRYFITVLAGPERRSAERLKRERTKNELPSAVITCASVTLLLLAVPAVIGLFHILDAIG